MRDSPVVAVDTRMIRRMQRGAWALLSELRACQIFSEPTVAVIRRSLTKQLAISTLSFVLMACAATTAPSEELTASLSITPEVLQRLSEPTIVVRVTNISDREVVLGGSAGCFLSFEVLDDEGSVVLANPHLARVCGLGVDELRLAPAETYEETTGWYLMELGGLQWTPVLPDGTYGLRIVVGIAGHGRVSLPPSTEVRIAMAEAAQPNRRMKLSCAGVTIH